ncbi:hypothetical protein IWW39_001017 [Coemansia spiralis]|uniref:AN1-type domain-containing protein n=1 Tax=Coemansia spiralis TaxID=417178 RepID=A0A9W8L6W2_9FUNG|nr:hypothetical protein IWW39_001017 [Coemansia spiralis]
MCSKCFKEQEQELQKENQHNEQQAAEAAVANPETAGAIATAVAAAVEAAAPSAEKEEQQQQQEQQSSPPALKSHVAAIIAEDALDAVPSLESSSAPGSTVQSPLVALSASVSGASTPTKRTQANKGRCFSCRARVPLVKQTTNKCRCDYVFCDTHRFPDQHDCEFDHMARDRLDLEKKNPRINVHRKGGRSFTRID